MARTVLMVSQPTVTGVAQCVLDWSKGLLDDGWRVEVACPDDGWLQTATADAGAFVHPWQSVRSPVEGVRGEIRSLSALLALVTPDVVLLHGSKAGLVGRLCIRGKLPTAFAPHAWSFEAVAGIVRTVALRWERSAARWTDRFLCVSEAERRTGLSSGIRGNYTVARNGVDTDALEAPPPAERERLRRALGLGADATVIVCVGRMCRQKGQDVLLSAWPLLRGEGRTLVFVGDGPLLEDLSSRTADERVTFTGAVSRESSIRWMTAADVVVLPSRWEGMALVPLESLAVGTPVVASDVDGARESVDPSVGELCAPGDSAALAAAVNRVLERPTEAQADLRAACRRRAESSLRLQDTVAVVSQALGALAR